MQTAYQTKPWDRFTRAIKTEATRKVYKNSMLLFMKSCHVDGTDNAGQLLDGDNQEIEDRIMDFIAAQNKEGLSDSIVNTRLAAIKLFYDMNRRPLAWKLIRKNVQPTNKHKDRAYTREEIAKMLELANIRARVIILLLASTGMRIGAVPLLKRKHLAPIDKYGIYKITVYEGAKEQHFTYCTPECRKAIDEYLAYRERCGEKYQTDKNAGEAPLVRKEFDKTDMRQVKHAEPIGETTATVLVQRIAIDVGIRERKPVLEGQNPARIRHDFKVMHGFRKYYDTVMTRAGISLLYIDLLEGHDVKLKGNYFKHTEEDLLEGNDKMLGYIAAINALTIDEEFRLLKQVDELKEELKSAAPRDMVYDLAKENKDLKERMNAMQEAQEEIRDLLNDPAKLVAILKEK